MNFASHADNGYLPSGGGILDQSAWFVSLWNTLTAEQSKIDNERARAIESKWRTT